MSTRLLLSDERLSGPVGVRRYVRPARSAHLVDRDSLADATALVKQLCDTWGGAYHLMIPVKRDTNEIAEPWLTLLRDSSPHATATRNLMPVPEPGSWPNYGGLWLEGSGGMSPIEALARLKETPDLTARTASGIDPADPWYVSYLAHLGLLPEPTDEFLGPLSQLRPGTTYDDLVAVDRSPPAGLSAQDLISGARQPGFCNAVDISCIGASLWHATVNTNIGSEGDPLIPIRFHKAHQHGPNLVVVYQPGSVEDLCLLWHIRAVHGLPPGLPIAIPDSRDVAQALEFLTRNQTLGSWGLRPTQGHLISASVGKDRLASIAKEVRSGQWTVEDWFDELRPSGGCGTGTTEVLLFDEGQATTSALTTDEREAFRAALSSYGAQLELEIHPVDKPLPRSESLGSRAFATYRSGHVVEVSERREVVTINWPSGIAVMQAIVKDRGLVAAPSQPGRLAEALLKNADRAGGLTPLMHSGAQGLLTTVSQRHGMNWFKSKLRSILADSETDLCEDLDGRLARIEERVAGLASAPNPDEQPDITFSNVQQALKDSKAAGHWLAWADRAGLLLRGARTECQRCSYHAWRPLNDLAPPMVCVGCGAAIERPYGYNDLKFRYRASELLLQAMKVDAVPHVLTFNYFSVLFGGRFGGVGPIYGGYPGVNFFADASKREPVGEADVLLVLADGQLAIGECKSRAAGLNQQELDKLWMLGDRLGVAFTFVATLDRAAVCGPPWRANPESANFAHHSLTAEHLFTLHPTHVLDENPLAWRDTFGEHRTAGGQADADHEAAVIRSLADLDAWERRGRLPWWLLPDDSTDG